jgi:hypothetical protein
MPKANPAAPGSAGYADLINAAAEATEAAEAAGDDALLSLAEGPKRRRGSRRKRRDREAGLGTLVGESVLSSRESVENFTEWWSRWQRSPAFKVLLAFVVIYALLAVVRKPSEVALERSRHAESMAYLENFLKSYSAAGGTVLARRPHGGAELFPRGVIMQGEFLDAFHRAQVGTTYSVRLTSPDANPLQGFYGFPPIYVGGTYFHLDRKFNFSLFRYRFLMRKDSETTGAILLARLEPAF